MNRGTTPAPAFPSATAWAAITGGDELEAVTRAYEVGATDFISKPINWPILGHRVLYVLRASDAIARLRIADAHNRAVLAAIPDTFFRLNREGFYLDYEQGHDASAGFSITDCVGSHIGDVLPSEIAARLLDQAHAVLATQHIGSVDYLNREGFYLDYEQGHDASAGFSITDCVGSHIRDVLPPEIAARLLDQAHAVLATQHIGSVDYTLTHEDSTRHFEARLVATGADEVLGLVRDISERKRTEEQIRRLA